MALMTGILPDSELMLSTEHLGEGIRNKERMLTVLYQDIHSGTKPIELLVIANIQLVRASLRSVRVHF